VYEAGFSILTGIDQATVGELTQFEEDTMMQAVGEILYAPSTMQKVAQEAGKNGIAVDAAGLSASSSLERKLSTWQVRVRNRDPKTAEKLAGIWLDIGYADLSRAYAHAILADGLARYLDSLESCLAHAVTSEPSGGLCGFRGLAEVEAEMSKTGARLAQERLSSRGLSSGLLVDQAEKDAFPARAVNFNSNQMVLAGGLIGLIAGVFIAQTNLARTFRKRQPRG
jgi:hypothetical protein